MRPAAALAAALALVAGCLGPPAAPDHRWRLEVAAPPALPRPALPGPLEVAPLRADDVVRGTALAWRRDASEHELHVRSHDLWVESPARLVSQQLASGLRAAGLAQAVVTPELRIDPAYRLLGSLLRFEEVRGPGAAHVVVEIEVALTDERSGALRLQATYLEAGAIEGEDVEAVVRAYDSALSAILARLVSDAAAAGP